MAADEAEQVFFYDYDLAHARNYPADKDPASHQSRALAELDKWYLAKPFPTAGAMLVLPTGGGKTFTAVRFLCRRALSDGYKVLWLAHTHHLLEQAYHAFDDSVSTIAEPKATMAMRVVSGTIGHFPVHQISENDDVIIGTLQTIGRAHANGHEELEKFLESADDKLFVVFDEAHHAPAPSYRQLIFSLRERCKKMMLLGLTATPTYSQEEKRGWLLKVFPQGIIHQVTPQELMATGILARPNSEQPKTNIVPQFDEREYQKWLSSHSDLPEEVITKLATNKDRNQFIASYYAENKKRFGKTIIFADRWFQCEQISTFLEKRRVKTGTVYSHIDADPGSSDARNKRDRDENSKVIQKFRDGKIDVLLNVRMLTEGTDVPDIKTVFLTRATTSKILLTQMVGRALRGPKFSGTKEAYIVSFVDEWKQLINWAEYDQLAEGMADDEIEEYGNRPPIQLISIELVRQLAEQMDSGVNMTPGPYTSLLPVGWYRVEYQAAVADTDEIDTVRELVMVFDSEEGEYQSFIEYIGRAKLKEFETESAVLADVASKVRGWIEKYFPEREEHFGSNIQRDLFSIARHTAQNGATPRFFPFGVRDDHDMDEIAQQYIRLDLGPRAIDERLTEEFNRADRLWPAVYYRYDLFKSQFDACLNRILHAQRHGANPKKHKPKRKTSPKQKPVAREPSEDIKRQVKERDQRCLCCGSESKRGLQVDHILSRYHGGVHQLNNLQTLCRECNRAKGTRDFNFLITHTNLSEAPSGFPELKPPSGFKAKDLELWHRYVKRVVNFSYRCAAVHAIEIGARGERHYNWIIELKPGNDPRWLKPLAKNILERVRKEREAAGFSVTPKTIVITAPKERKIVVK